MIGGGGERGERERGRGREGDREVVEGKGRKKRQTKSDYIIGLSFLTQIE